MAKLTQQNQLSFETVDGQVVMVGALNRNSVPGTWQQRRHWAAGEGPLTLDLAKLESVDSAGLAMFIQLKAELEQAGRSLALHNVNKQLVAFAEVSGVTELLSLT